MKTVFRHIIIYLLAAVVMIATTGVSFHCLYCYCKGETVASFLKPGDPCEQAEMASPESCCKGLTCATSDKDNHHDCSDCNSQYLSLDVDYLVPNFKISIAAPFTHLPGFSVLEAEVNITDQKVAWENDIPPPAGRDLLILIESFLC